MTDLDAHVVEWMFHLRAEADSGAASLAFALQKRIGERAYWACVDPAGMHPDNDTVPLPKGDSEEDLLTIKIRALRDELETVTRLLRQLQSERKNIR